MEETNIQTIKESIKLAKMSKGYQWEIKILDDKLENKTIKRLEDLNKIMEEKYGQDNSIKI